MDSDEITPGTSGTRKPEMKTFDPVDYAKSPYNEERLMKNIKLREIAALLTGKSSPTTSEQTNFCVEESLSSTDIQVSVEGVGNLEFPIPQETIQKLKDVSSKAKFGLGENTVLDENVRDTQFIESAKLQIKINEKSLFDILKRMQSCLGIEGESKLKAELHNMLIYGPGQFFDRHRDSEKIPNMVATLVIVLPSPHIGGSLVVEHNDQKHKVRTENFDESNAKCICFYSDCWHLIKKVRQGYRIVLTYNVALQDCTLGFTMVDEDLKNAVQSYFEDESECQNDQSYFEDECQDDDCKKLVFLLNHSYSQHSLKWPLLKGEDQSAGMKFLAVAKYLDLKLHLVLVNISQNMLCGDDECHYTDDMELIESDHTIIYWIDENNVALPYIKFKLNNSNICFTKETFYKNFEPKSIDISGPTGNEGCTSDYYYERAAIVVFKKSNLEKIEFEVNFEAALKDLHGLTKTSDNEAELLRIINITKNDFIRKAENSYFQIYVDIALYAKNEVIADIILSKFSGSIILPEHIQQFVALQKQYGTKFCINLFKAWLQLNHVPSLSPFTALFINAGGNKDILEAILETTITKITKSYFTKNYNHLDIFKACDEIGNKKFQDIYAKYLTSKDEINQLDVVNIFIELQNTVPKNSKRFEPFKLILLETVKSRIEKIKSNGFWYMDKFRHCNCDVCKSLNGILKSNKESLTINGGKMKYRHLINRFYAAKINVNFEGKGKNGVITIKKDQCVYKDAEKEFTQLTTFLNQFNTEIGESSGISTPKKMKK